MEINKLKEQTRKNKDQLCETLIKFVKHNDDETAKMEPLVF